jgi:hypothetical protein
MTLCCRAERRTVHPGLRRDTGQTSLGQPVYDRQTRLWLVIDGTTETPVGMGGNRFELESHMLVTDYFEDKAAANAVCLTLHDMRCPLRKCGWSEVERKANKPTENPKERMVKYFGGWRPTP